MSLPVGTHRAGRHRHEGNGSSEHVSVRVGVQRRHDSGEWTDPTLSLCSLVVQFEVCECPGFRTDPESECGGSNGIRVLQQTHADFIS